MMRNKFSKLFIIACLFTFVTSKAQDKRPNVLWITIEDWSPDLSCYGTKGISTPNVDKLASEGVLYKKAAGVFASGFFY